MARVLTSHANAWIIALVTLHGLIQVGCTSRCRPGAVLKNGSCFAKASDAGPTDEQQSDAQKTDGVETKPMTDVSGAGASGGRATATNSVPTSAATITAGASASIQSPAIAESAGANASTPSADMATSASSAAGAGAAGANSGSASQCPGGGEPSPEICDGIDNDCDRSVDEELTMECGSSTKGMCQKGSQGCVGGSWEECHGAIEPAEESCDADMLDEDCDGQVNEGCSCVEGEAVVCGKNVGICRQGNQQCQDGVVGPCTGAVEPDSRETCDGTRDDDCDGKVDEGCACTDNDSEPCVGSGACTQGMRTCSNGRWGQCQGSSVCTGEQMCDPRSARCVDCLDGATRPCGDISRAPCKLGTQSCRSNRWDTTCTGAVLPAAEDICNGKDDDCNGKVDDGCAASQSCRPFKGEQVCAEAAPSGDYLSSCQDCIKQGTLLQCASCGSGASSLALPCSGSIANCGSKLRCMPPLSRLMSQGDFSGCMNIAYKNCEVSATCLVMPGLSATIDSSVSADCTSSIRNCGGYLRCTPAC